MAESGRLPMSASGRELPLTDGRLRTSVLAEEKGNRFIFQKIDQSPLFMSEFRASGVSMMTAADGDFLLQPLSRV